MKPTDRDKTTKPEKLDKQLERLQSENERLKRENEYLRQELVKALRLAWRQAAPFSRGEPNGKPKRPGRKPATRYGSHQRRKPPSQVDEAIAVPIRNDAGAAERQRGSVGKRNTRKTSSLAPYGAASTSTLGCACRGRGVQGRDARQMSDAFGTSGVDRAAGVEPGSIDDETDGPVGG